MIASLPRTEMLRLSLALVLAAVGSALTGCGSNSISLQELPAELERRACARAVACGGAESQTACESTLFLAENQELLTLNEAVKRGTVRYDAASAGACLNAITTDCADLVEPAACNNVFRGTVPAGGVCVTGAECADRGRCLGTDTCTAACCPGTCEAVGAPIAIGGACDYPSSSTPCVEGAFCDNDRTCMARRPVGAGCSGAPDECLDPAVCLYRPDGSGETCTVISTAPGAACVPGANFGCGREDETCNATTSLCTKRATPGAACQSTDDCVLYAYCDTAAGTCKARPTLGQACDNNAGIGCAGGLICPSGVCAAPPTATACVP
jgi:hypothetical protein